MISQTVLPWAVPFGRGAVSSLRRGGRLRYGIAWSLGLAAAAVVVSAPVAFAAVDIAPAQGVQGEAASVTFEVQNLRPGAYTTKVEIGLPPDQPVAEVFPMTHPDWAPQIVSHPVASPLVGTHGGQVFDVTSAVIWTRAEDAPTPPAVERLRLELGPLPAAKTFVFSVTQTYSDGTVQRWQGPTAAAAGRPAGPGTVLTLAPAAGPQVGHPHGAGPTAGDATVPGVAGAQETAGQVGSDGLLDATPPVGAAADTPAAPFSALPVIAVLVAIGCIVVAVEAAGGRRFIRVTMRPASPASPASVLVDPGSALVGPGSALADPVAVGAAGAGDASPPPAS